jgi:hypothetical protein
MITNVTGGPGVVVQGGYTNQIYLNPSPPGNPSSGELRYNNHQIEVYDGQVWRELQQGHVQVGMTPAAEAAINWAEKKMAEERELEELAKQFPMLEDAMRDLEVIKVLVSGKRNHDIQQS